MTLKQLGEYRIDAFESGHTNVLVMRGQADVFENGNSVIVHPQESMSIDGGTPTYDIGGLPQRDEWDNWNEQRDNQLAQAQSPRYVDKEVSGVEDLDQYGRWVNTPDYGYTWQPNVAADWFRIRMVDGVARSVWMDLDFL